LRKVTIFPFDVHPGAFGKVHFDRFGIGMGHSERFPALNIVASAP
jgi:hypothetical protein